eukprot:4255330-Pleurochrysis_carterae.AAC.1
MREWLYHTLHTSSEACDFENESEFFTETLLTYYKLRVCAYRVPCERARCPCVTSLPSISFCASACKTAHIGSHDKRGADEN